MGWLRNFVQRAKFRWSYRVATRRSDVLLSAGMPRSGSTWLFNAARLLLRAHHETSSGWIGDWAQLARKPLMLVKVHEHDPFLARHARAVLYSYRDVRDALASNQRKFGIVPTIGQARSWIASDRYWRAHAIFSLRYESMMAAPAVVVEELACALPFRCGDPEQVVRQLAAIECPAGQADCGTYDVETLLHPGHITDGRHGRWKDQLCSTLVRQIETEFGDWLDENGYAISEAVGV